MKTLTKAYEKMYKDVIRHIGSKLYGKYDGNEALDIIKNFLYVDNIFTEEEIEELTDNGGDDVNNELKYKFIARYLMWDGVKVNSARKYLEERYNVSDSDENIEKVIKQLEKML